MNLKKANLAELLLEGAERSDDPDAQVADYKGLINDLVGAISEDDLAKMLANGEGYARWILDDLSSKDIEEGDEPRAKAVIDGFTQNPLEIVAEETAVFVNDKHLFGPGVSQDERVDILLCMSDYFGDDEMAELKDRVYFFLPTPLNPSVAKDVDQSLKNSGADADMALALIAVASHMKATRLVFSPFGPELDEDGIRAVKARANEILDPEWGVEP